MINQFELLKKSYLFFRKPKITVFIISSLLVIFVMGLIIPQKRFFASLAQYNQWKSQYPAMSGVVEFFQLNEIYMSPITIFLLGLFFANLIVVLAHRIPNILRRAYLIDTERSLSLQAEQAWDQTTAGKITVRCTDPNEMQGVAGKVSAFFGRKFWSVFRSSDPCFFVAVKNRLSPIGFLIFHASFLFCLLGGLIVVYTRFSGNLLLTEGEEFNSDIRQFRIIKNDPIVLKELPDLGILLQKVSPSYDGTTPTDLNVSLRIKYMSETYDVSTKINEPVNKGPISILPVSVGVSPLFILKEKTGKEIAGGYFSLNILKGDEDYFVFQDIPYRIYVKFYPDYIKQNGEPATASWSLNNPVFKLSVEKGGKKAYEGYVRAGEVAEFDGLELRCADIRYWVDFLVVREYGNTLLMAGFILGAIGLLMRLVFFQKTVRVHLRYHDGGCTIFISGRSEYYEQTFNEELDNIVKAISTQCGLSIEQTKGEHP